ncbi:MAG: hypothetical protein ABW252_01475 [Polyangiales bacterium]
MRRLDDLPPGTYELELLREERAPDPKSSLGEGGAYKIGVPRRVLRVVSTSEDVEDDRWITQASPSTRFRAKVKGVRDVTVTRL